MACPSFCCIHVLTSTPPPLAIPSIFPTILSCKLPVSPYVITPSFLAFSLLFDVVLTD